ncbi:MAG: matrixin family metalloprotease, partial [Candidatus Pacearchaeota archaeon]
MKSIFLIFFSSVLFITFFIFYFYEYNFSLEQKIFIPTYENKIVGKITEGYLKQFVAGMRFSTNNISYYIDPSCSEEKKSRMVRAFSILEKEVGNIFFYELNNISTQILILCSENVKKEDKKIFILGEGGPTKFLNFTPYPLILEGEINLYSKKNIKNCDYPVVELHELLHVFGFDHIEKKDFILYPYLDCNQRLNEEIVNKLREIYSEEAKAELFFNNFSAYKKGPYLNFNLEVKNTGLIEAKNVSLEIYKNTQKIKDYSLENILPGYSKKLKVENFYLKNIKENKINFKITSNS